MQNYTPLDISSSVPPQNQPKRSMSNRLKFSLISTLVLVLGIASGYVLISRGIIFSEQACGTGGCGTKKCVLEFTKSSNKTNVKPGDSIEFTLNFKNTGSANCTGGGVGLKDRIADGLTFVSETHSDNLRPGYASAKSSAYVEKDKTVEYNGDIVSPGESGYAKIIVKVNEIGGCGSKATLYNTGEINAAEFNYEWQKSNTVTLNVSKECITPTSTPTNTPSPTPTPVPKCGSDCSSSSGCPASTSCVQGKCVLNECLASGTVCDETKCTVIPPTPTPSPTPTTCPVPEKVSNLKVTCPVCEAQ